MGLWSAMIERVASLLAYFPPKPPSYRLERDTGNRLVCRGGFITTEMERCLVVELDTPRRRGGGGGEKIVAIHVPYSGGKARMTLLHSHGNAVDLGIMQSMYCHLSETLGVNVLGYDYSGYGWSTGKPSIRNTLADVRACYNYLVDELKVRPKDVVLYGQSVGSGPTCELASKLGDDLGGVILHSPLASGVRVLKPSVEKWPVWCDIYPNHEHVKKIRAPTLVMHGTADEVIHISNAYLLHSSCLNPVAPLWMEGYNHQNLEFAPEYLERLQLYFHDLTRDRR